MKRITMMLMAFVLMPLMALSTTVSELLPSGVSLVSNGGCADWSVVTKDSQTVLQSGTIDDGEYSALELSVSGKGKLTFEWLASSESGYDFLRYYSDGTHIMAISGTDLSWETRTVEFKTEGTHTVKWKYEKDVSALGGNDCGWVRNIKWSPAIVYSWKYSVEDDGAIITGVSPAEGDVEIPSIIDGYPVVGIGHQAFFCDGNITSVVIPEGVKTIGDEAFCSVYNITSITIPRSVTAIGRDAFYNCWNVSQIHITDLSKWCEIEFSDEDANPFSQSGSAAFYLNGSRITDLVIPNNVRVIRDYAFRRCLSLTSLTIPNSVVTIGDYAFSYCTGIESVTIGTGLRSVGEHAFERCDALKSVYISDIASWCAVSCGSAYDSSPLGSKRTLYLNGQTIKNLVIPNGVTAIGSRAFYKCTSITSVSLPEGLADIGSYAFYGCSGLSTLTLPQTMTNVGDYAVAYCSGLSSLRIPDAVRSVGAGAFSDCSALKSVTVGTGVEYFGKDAFCCCNALAEVYISDLAKWCAITFGTSGSFTYYNSLTSNPLSMAKHLYMDGSEVIDLVIPEGVTSIGGGAFLACPSFASLTLPEGLESVGDCAFKGCTGLTSLTLPATLGYVGYESFKGCTGLTFVEVRNHSAQRYCNAFGECASIRSVVVPGCITMSRWFPASYKALTSAEILDGETAIAESAFAGCAALSELKVPDSATTMGDKAFEGCSGLLDDEGFIIVKDVLFGYKGTAASVEIPEGITAISANAFSGCSMLAAVTIPNTVASIGDSAFEKCTGLTSVMIPDSVTALGEAVFSGCSKLSSVKLPQSLAAIGERMFYNCSVLSSIAIPEGVDSIGECAFYGCSALSSISIPANVSEISSYAFYSCNGLKAVHIDDMSKWCAIRFGNEYANPLMFARHLYLNNVEVIDLIVPDGTDAVLPYAFCGGAAFKAVTLPEGLSSIGNDAFYMCSGLTEVVIPDGVASLGWGVFYGCTSLAAVTLPDSVTEIGMSAFHGCSSLVSIALPDGLSAIPEQMFYNCSDLVSVVIPEHVTSIGDRAFNYCSSLASVNMPQAVTHVGESAFSSTLVETVSATGIVMWEDCVLGLQYGSSPTQLVLPAGARVIADNAFSYNSTIQSVSMPNTLRGVGNRAFYECSSLRSIAFPDGVESIGDYVLYDCDNLRTVTIPGSVKRIGNYAIADSGYVESITLGEGIEEIGDRAFYRTGYQYVYKNISNSVKINIPSTVKSIGSWAFECIGYKCANVSVADIAKWCEIDFEDNVSVPWYYFGSSGGTIDHLTWTGTRWGLLTIPYGPKRISAYAFSSWPFQEVSIPSSVESIETSAFQGSSIRIVKIPSSIVRIDDCAFSNCKYLNTVYVDIGDADRVRELMRGKGADVDSLKFIEVEPVCYTITLEYGLGGDPEPLAVKEGALLVDELPTPTQSGAVFLGWFTQAEGGGSVTDEMRALSDMTLCAHWERKTVAELLQGMKDVSSSGDAEWYADRDDGQWVIHSGAISDSQYTELEASVSGAGKLTFEWRASSEVWKSTPIDKCELYVDGVWRQTIGGETDWIAYECELEKGLHSVSWKYIKDESDFADLDCAWLRNVKWTPTGPSIADDSDAIVTGDSEIGYVIIPSEGKKCIEVTISEGVEAAKVTVEVGTDVETVKPNGAKVKVVKGMHDITDYLDIPAADEGGNIDLTKAAVKESVVKEALDPEKGAVVELNADAPKLTTAETKPGLTYTFSEGTTVMGLTQKFSKVGDGSAWTPEVSVKGGSSGFYSIGVKK